MISPETAMSFLLPSLSPSRKTEQAVQNATSVRSTSPSLLDGGTKLRRPRPLPTLLVRGTRGTFPADSVTRWIRADFPPKILKFPQFFPTILRIPNLIVKFPKPKKVGFIILNYLEIVAYGALAQCWINNVEKPSHYLLKMGFYCTKCFKPRV